MALGSKEVLRNIWDSIKKLLKKKIFWLSLIIFIGLSLLTGFITTVFLGLSLLFAYVWWQVYQNKLNENTNKKSRSQGCIEFKKAEETYPFATAGFLTVLFGSLFIISLLSAFIGFRSPLSKTIAIFLVVAIIVLWYYTQASTVIREDDQIIEKGLARFLYRRTRIQIGGGLAYLSLPRPFMDIVKVDVRRQMIIFDPRLTKDEVMDIEDGVPVRKIKIEPFLSKRTKETGRVPVFIDFAVEYSIVNVFNFLGIGKNTLEKQALPNMLLSELREEVALLDPDEVVDKRGELRAKFNEKFEGIKSKCEKDWGIDIIRGMFGDVTLTKQVEDALQDIYIQTQKAEGQRITQKMMREEAVKMKNALKVDGEIAINAIQVARKDVSKTIQEFTVTGGKDLADSVGHGLAQGIGQAVGPAVITAIENAVKSKQGKKDKKTKPIRKGGKK